MQIQLEGLGVVNTEAFAKYQAEVPPKDLFFHHFFSRAVRMRLMPQAPRQKAQAKAAKEAEAEAGGKASAVGSVRGFGEDSSDEDDGLTMVWPLPRTILTTCKWTTAIYRLTTMSLVSEMMTRRDVIR